MANKVIERRTYDDWKLFCEQVQDSTAVNISETAEAQTARKKRALKDYAFFFNTYLPVFSDNGKTECADFHINLANEVELKKRPESDPNKIAIAEWPREHAKSVHVTIGIPMWKIARKTLTGMLLMGKNEDDAANLLSDIQAQLQFNALFIHDFGDQFNFGDWQDGDFTTKEGIRFLAFGRDQSPRGARKGQLRPNYGAVDDVDDDVIVNNQKRVKKIVARILGAMFFGLDTRGGTLVVAGNRIHAQSILAHMVGDIKPGAPKREGIYHSKIYAIDPKTGRPAWWQRYTLAMIMSKVKAAGVFGRTEFFHENHVEGEIFKDAMLHWIKMWHLIRLYTMIIGYFDPSFENNPTSDFKAVRVWGGLNTSSGDWQRHCLKSFVRRAPIIDAFAWMSAINDKLPPGVAILWYMEKQFTNKLFMDALSAHNKERIANGKKQLVVLLDETQKDPKYIRMVQMQPSYLNGENYYNLDEMYNPDMIEGNNQLKGIEPGYQTPDDAPDADQGAWNLLDQHKPSANFRPIIGRVQKQNRL
ncbi:hypothetical protein [Mucilaginibacter sp.]|uniref:hypothetical protein n=1 Tax=Mucilaginibacter sp. TaxID=1882438 RepID=UPI000CADBDE2|nr:hypothetical protein [Mucilaginibacter sp.]PLW89992.1 MAG: hypothetical protein C0154_08695 [Mucilaginibacter sp.]PMP65786.1 MAG: hypothetical protein C0191_02685 [Mucilaginibacter sp.]